MLEIWLLDAVHLTYAVQMQCLYLIHVNSLKSALVAQKS